MKALWMLKGVVLIGEAVVCLRECQIDQDVYEDPARMLLYEQTTPFCVTTGSE